MKQPFEQVDSAGNAVEIRDLLTSPSTFSEGLW